MAKLSDIISTPDLAGYVRDSEAITWAETQTFKKLVELRKSADPTGLNGGNAPNIKMYGFQPDAVTPIDGSAQFGLASNGNAYMRTRTADGAARTAGVALLPEGFLVNETDSGIKHNIAAFTLDFATGNVVSGGLPFQGTPEAWTITIPGSGTSGAYIQVDSNGLVKQLVASLEFVSSGDPAKSLQIDANQNIAFFDGNGDRIGNNTSGAQVSVIAVF